MGVLILGAGIVGLTLANLLLAADLPITIIDRTLPPTDWDTSLYDLRCSAITPAAEQVLRKINVWSLIAAERVGKFERMEVWEQNQHGKVNFNAAALGCAHLGHIIENRIMLRALYQRLQSSAKVIFKVGNCQAISVAATQVTLAVDNHEISGDLIIGADGANSWLRAATNLPSYGWSYEQSALVATVRSQYPHNSTARQRFALDGPLAFLPLDDPYLSSIVWTSKQASIEQLLQLSAGEFCAALVREFNTLGSLELHGERAQFPLRMQHVNNYVQARVALVGDAAHVIHPLAGQGLNLGIMDAKILSEKILAAHMQRQDIGSHKILRKYERARKGHNLSMIMLMESIKRLFAVDSTILSEMRSTGMLCIDRLPWIKEAIMRYATGIDLQFQGI